MPDSRCEQFPFKTGQNIKSFSISTKGPVDAVGDLAEPLGYGGSGVVYLARQNLYGKVGIDRAIKFFVYREDVAESLGKGASSLISKDEFITEVSMISSLNHEHLMKVIDAGVYEIDGKSIPFLVSEFIPGPTMRDICQPPSGEDENDFDKAESIAKARALIVENPDSVLDFALEIASAIIHMHRCGIVHCDVAPKNIFLDENQRYRPVLGDLGLCKNLKIERERVYVAGTRRFMPKSILRYWNSEVPWSEFKTWHPWWDWYSYSATICEVLETGLVPHTLSWYQPLRATLHKMMEEGGGVTPQKLVDRLEFLKPTQRQLAAVPELTPALSGKNRRLMPIQSVQTTKRTAALIKHPVVQRMRDVPQLTSVWGMFPGGTHRRYEHALGVMENVRQYIVALCDNSEFLQHLSIDKIESALLLGLLHGVSRFPFSNVVHEIRQKNRDSLSLLSKGTLLDAVWQMRDDDGNTIDDLIRELFPHVDREVLHNLISSKTHEFDEGDRFVYSLLNCSLDARVVDFVRRDSLHIGLTRGEAFQLDELLPHLTMHRHRLALRNTGATIAEQIVGLRYWLYNRVYWNRPNRALCAMLRFLFMEMSNLEGSEVMYGKILSLTEHDILTEISRLGQNNGREDIVGVCELLLKPHQRIYKTVFEVSKKEYPDYAEACDRFGKYSFQQIRHIEADLSEQIRSTINLEGVAEMPVVLADMPYEPGELKLGQDIIVIRPSGEASNLADFSGIVSGINGNFESYLRKLRLFIHPSVRLSDEDQKVISEMMGDYFFEKV